MRGSRGGYRLAKDSSSISLRAVLEALEGETAVPALPRSTAARDRDTGAVVRHALDTLVRAWNAKADAVTLDSLAEKYRHIKSHGAPMYEI